MRVWLGIAATVFTVATALPPLFAAPAAPSREDWGKLQTYAAWLCRETLVAASCGIDTKPMSDSFVEIRGRYTLTDEQQGTLKNDQTVCLGGKPPPPKASVEPQICAGAARAALEMNNLFDPAQDPRK